ncbi:MAG: hypothetical protein AAF810_22110 [Cyanobacteria bacterium P01_D01_bin.36]
MAVVVLALYGVSCVGQEGAIHSATSSQEVASVQPVSLSEKQRGVSWVGGPEVVVQADLDALVKTNVDWIVQTPFGWQEDYDSPHVTLASEGDNYWWGETDIGLITTAQLAENVGIHTLLKPHIWLTRPSEGKWRSDIDMASEDDWQAWFDSYRMFMLHYAVLAETHHMPILCIGTELQNTAVKREQDWRQLIADIRQVYAGKLTYAGNWHNGFETIPFWDALDFIGIQAYFPLTDQVNPTVEELKAGWQPHIEAIERVQQRYQKPVIFTELGYRSVAEAAIAPWEWPDSEAEARPRDFSNVSGLATQANCYDAFFQSVWPQDWLAGVYVWKWFPKLSAAPGTQPWQGFTPQHKPAEDVLRDAFMQSKTSGASL